MNIRRFAPLLICLLILLPPVWKVFEFANRMILGTVVDLGAFLAAHPLVTLAAVGLYVWSQTRYL